MIIRVRVKPGAGENRIKKVANGEYEVFVKERAEDGKANRRLINMLAKEFHVSYNNIKIKNPKSRKKVVEIKDV